MEYTEMYGFVKTDNTTTLSIKFDVIERLRTQLIIFKYSSSQLKKGEISFSEGKKLDGFAKKFNNKLFLGFIGNRDKDTIIDLTPDEIRKLLAMTLVVKNNEYEILHKKSGFVNDLKYFRDIFKLHLKFTEIIKDNPMYFEVSGEMVPGSLLID
jgi:hypothetical protein